MKPTSDHQSDLFAREAPARGKARHRRRSEHYYVGRRPQETEVYVVSQAAIEPLEHHGYRSSAAFDWGLPSQGALELAYAMLTHSADSQPPDPICMMFWTEVVANLDRSGFVLGHGEIALWLLTAFRDGPKRPLRRGRRLRDQLRWFHPWGRGRQ